MNFRGWFNPTEDSFQIAPLIDIVFLLLIFFIVTGALEAVEKETPIELPRTTAAVMIKREKLDVVVNVTREGEIHVHGQEYSVERFRQVLSDIQESANSAPISVIIRADGKAFHKDVVKVIDACVNAKIRNISFVSINEDKKEIE